MVSGGNVTYTCKQCGNKFLGWASAKRLYCGRECADINAPKRALRHGESRSRLYTIWCDIKNRCYCEKTPGFAYYGARGIRVCDEWRNSYETFRDWSLSTGYHSSLEIDRKDANGNYEPTNCRWATRKQQMSNTRKRKNARTSKFKGVSRHTTNNAWIAQIHQSKKTFNLGSFRTELAAALRYDDEAVLRFGEYARINFPERKRLPVKA